MKKCGEKSRKTITLDITEWYERLKEISGKEIRSIEEQCRFFIKKGVEGTESVTTIMYTQNTCPSYTYPSYTYTGLWQGDSDKRRFGNACYEDECRWSSSTASNAARAATDCELNSSTGCYEAKA